MKAQFWELINDQSFENNSSFDSSLQRAQKQQVHKLGMIQDQALRKKRLRKGSQGIKVVTKMIKSQRKDQGDTWMLP